MDPAIKLKDVPKTDLLLLTHNHYDHLDASAIRNFPHNMQYSDIEIDVIMPRSSDDIPLTQIALIDENNNNIVTTVDVRRGGKVAFADSYPWGKAALSLRHLVKLAGPDPIKNKIMAAINVVIFASKIAVLDFV